MGFAVSADAYDRFMGRYSQPLAPLFADFAGVVSRQQALDVGCGTGKLTTELVRRIGKQGVVAVDPSVTFVQAVTASHPGVKVHRASAERLPLPDATFDVALAQLVVHFMADPVAGLAQMARVTRPGGLVGACVWDHAGGSGPLSLFWRAVHDVDPHATDESGLAGAREGHLAELFTAAGVKRIQPTTLTVRVLSSAFADWWEPFTLGVGPAGAYLAGLDEARRGLVRARCARLLPAAPFELAASAWCVTGRT
jgi:SAM-dependent methyltransferase